MGGYNCDVLFQKLSDKPLNKILGASLDSEMLTDIIRVLNDAFVKNNLPVDHILRELGANDQTHILSLFFSTEDKERKSNRHLRAETLIISSLHSQAYQT